MTRRAHALGALAAFLLAVAIIAPCAFFIGPAETDEEEYIWSAAYFGDKVARLDFAPSGASAQVDPGWSPTAWWSLTQPMGTRLLYAAALGLSSAEAPRSARGHLDPGDDGAAAHTTPGTLLICRLAGALAAALGFTLIAWRIGPRALLMMLGLLAIPPVQMQFALAWAEGPLLLGFGLCILTYGTRWFPTACGVAATFKLTALGLWPLLLVPGAAGPFRRGLALALTLLTWTILTPSSWFAYGPLYLVNMLDDRVYEFQAQAATLGAPNGFYLPLRYLWPFELALLLGGLWLSRRIAETRARRQHAPANLGQGGGWLALKRSA